MWARVDDGWWCHPKVMGASLACRGLWVSALSWTCAQRTAVVPASFLAMVGGTVDLAAELVERGLWRPHAEGWEIHDWAEYQELSVSEKRSEAGKRGGKRSGEARRSKTKQTDAVTSGNDEANVKQTEASDEAGTHPVPSRPDPDPDLIGTTTSGDGDPEVSPDDVEQQVRKTAVLIGRMVAVEKGANDERAYAATVTADLLAQLDGAERDRIFARLVDGETPEQIAATWTPLPMADPLTGRRPAAPQADPAAVEAAREAAAKRLAATDDVLAKIRAEPERRMTRDELRAMTGRPPTEVPA